MVHPPSWREKNKAVYFATLHNWRRHSVSNHISNLVAMLVKLFGSVQLIALKFFCSSCLTAIAIARLGLGGSPSTHPTELIFVTNITNYICGENLFVEKFQMSVKNLNNLWSFIEIYAVFVPNLCGDKSA